MIRQKSVEKGIGNNKRRTVPSLASTSAGRTDNLTTQMVKWSREQDGHFSRYKYDRWILETSIFKLILRMQAVILMLVSPCILIDIMDLIPSIKFLASKTRRWLSHLEGRVVGNECSLRNKFPQ